MRPTTEKDAFCNKQMAGGIVTWTFSFAQGFTSQKFKPARMFQFRVRCCDGEGESNREFKEYNLVALSEPFRVISNQRTA